MAWQIKYSNHLKERVKTRKLPFGLARDILIFAIERYHDTMTHYLVAIGAGEYEGKTREFFCTESKKEREVIKQVKPQGECVAKQFGKFTDDGLCTF